MIFDRIFLEGRRMNELYTQTPQIESLPLSRILGVPVYLKLESSQPSGSFKNRGIGRLVEYYVQKGKTRLIAASGGNAGLAAAYAGRKLGVSVLVVVPSTTIPFVQDQILAEGAEIMVHGHDLDEAERLAKELAKEDACAFIPPYDDPKIWEGNSSIVYETYGSGFKPGAIVLSVGGGGLLSGIAMGLHEVNWQDVPIVTSETEGAASFAKSVYANQIIKLDEVNTIASTLAVKEVCRQSFEWTKKHTILPQVVTDRAAAEACAQFAEDHRILVEPSCGASLALLYQGLPYLKTVSSVLVIVCGGCGVNRYLIDKWLEETVS